MSPVPTPSEHPLDDLVRTIDPARFSPATHGDGHRIVLDGDKVRFHAPTFFGRLFGERGETHYFVKKWSVPKEVKSWTFHWSEGTSAISLDFTSSFVLQANEDVQALKLVDGLRGSAPIGEMLYGAVNARLHEELERLLRESDSKAASLLDCFRRSSAGVGESDELNRRVSERVSQALGGALFRIGFQLQNAPPMQIEVRQADDFTLADSRQVRKAETTALLHLENYQAYKKSGLETEADVRRTVGLAISQAVKQLLFAGKYYDVVRSFARDADSIEQKMLERVRHEARSIGYRVDMFQSFPDIGALKLLNPLRIDIPAGDDKYYLVNSTGYVQVGVAVSVRVGQDFSRLHLLIDPDVDDVASPIAAQVKRICRDTIQGFDRMKFNLKFADIVVPAITRAIVDGLGGYGLVTQVIHVVQSPTEDAQRFMAIRGRTIGFEALIDAQADAGNTDDIVLGGKIEVTGMAEDGWERFEAKDFGYRQDSHLTEARLRAMAAEQLVELSGAEPLAPAERRLLAVDLELRDIRDRVVNTLREALSKVRDLASAWRSMDNSRDIIERAQLLAAKAVEAEFGLTVALRGVRRGNTDGEQTNAFRNQKRFELLRENAQIDIAQELESRRQFDAGQQQLLEHASRIDRDALDDEMHPQHEAVRRRVEQAADRARQGERLSGQGALDLLPGKRPDAPGRDALPWNVPAAASPADKGLPAPGGEAPPRSDSD